MVHCRFEALEKNRVGEHILWKAVNIREEQNSRGYSQSGFLSFHKEGVTGRKHTS